MFHKLIFIFVERQHLTTLLMMMTLVVEEREKEMDPAGILNDIFKK